MDSSFIISMYAVPEDTILQMFSSTLILVDTYKTIGEAGALSPGDVPSNFVLQALHQSLKREKQKPLL